MRSLENPTESRQQAGSRSRQAAADSVARAESVHASLSCLARACWRLAAAQPANRLPCHAARRMEDYDSMTHANTLPYEIVEPPRL